MQPELVMVGESGAPGALPAVPGKGALLFPLPSPQCGGWGYVKCLNSEMRGGNFGQAE